MKKFFLLQIFFSFCLRHNIEGTLHKLYCEISAPKAILINADNGNVLFEKKAHELCFPASTTKIATVLYALHKKKSDLVGSTIASKDAVSIVPAQVRRNSGKHPSYRLEFGGTHANIKVGEEIDIATLIHAVMLKSANDASNVLAEWTSGSIATFMEELNVFLQRIGCTNTHFTNPHGLPDTTHVTTVADLAKMAYYAQKYPFFRKVASTVKYEYGTTNKQTSFWMTQTNALLKPGKYYYPYATGMKTGYIHQSHNLIASASKGDRNLIAVICGCEERSQRYRSAVNLFEMAFEEEKVARTLLSRQHEKITKAIEGAKTVVEAVLESDLTCFFYPSEEPCLSPKVEWFALSLPIASGQEVGRLYAVDDMGKQWASVALFASKTVEPKWEYKIKKTTMAVWKWSKTNKAYLGYTMGVLWIGSSFYLLQRKRLKRRGNGTF